MKTPSSILKPSIHFIAIFFLLLISAYSHSASQKVITDDGREVLLNDNGSWHYTGDTALKPKEKTQSPEIQLQKVVIEKYEKKALKNTRLKTRTVFYLQLKHPLQETNIEDDDISRVEVKDNNGKNYPVLAIKLNTDNSLLVYAEKSPSIMDDAKSMQIIFKSGIFDIKDPVTLSRKITDFEQLNVNGFN